MVEPSAVLTAEGTNHLPTLIVDRVQSFLPSLPTGSQVDDEGTEPPETFRPALRPLDVGAGWQVLLDRGQFRVGKQPLDGLFAPKEIFRHTFSSRTSVS